MEGGTIFRKATDERVQDFRHSGAFLLEHLHQEPAVLGDSQHSEGSAHPVLPLLPHPVPPDVKTTSALTLSVHEN